MEVGHALPERGIVGIILRRLINFDHGAIGGAVFNSTEFQASGSIGSKFSLFSMLGRAVFLATQMDHETLDREPRAPIIALPQKTL